MQPSEKIEKIKLVYNLLKELTEDGALAGVVLTDRSFDQLKAIFGANAIPMRVAEIELDPHMEHSFVVDKLLIMRGTQLNG